MNMLRYAYTISGGVPHHYHLHTPTHASPSHHHHTSPHLKSPSHVTHSSQPHSSLRLESLNQNHTISLHHLVTYFTYSSYPSHTHTNTHIHTHTHTHTHTYTHTHTHTHITHPTITYRSYTHALNHTVQYITTCSSNVHLRHPHAVSMRQNNKGYFTCLLLKVIGEYNYY